MSNEDRRDGEKQNNPFKIKELQEKWPYLPWLSYMNAMLPNKITLDENEVIIVIAPAFFDRLGSVLNSTSKRTIANYLMWRTVLALSDFLNDEMRRKKIDHFRTVSGQQEVAPRWKECITYTTSA